MQEGRAGGRGGVLFNVGLKNIINTNKWAWDGQLEHYQKISLSREYSKHLLNTTTYSLNMQ